MLVLTRDAFLLPTAISLVAVRLGNLALLRGRVLRAVRQALNLRLLVRNIRHHGARVELHLLLRRLPLD